MYYVIKANSTFYAQVTLDNTVVDEEEYVAVTDVAYEDSAFIGYTTCDCCDELLAKFIIDEYVNANGYVVKHYVYTDAVNVVECAGKHAA